LEVFGACHKQHVDLQLAWRSKLYLLSRLSATILLMSSAVLAQEPPPNAPATAISTEANSLPAICTDRPSKATSACTVPQGSFQLETDLINWTRFDFAGTRTDTILYTNPVLKYGLTNSTDVEASITPYETVRTRDASGVSTLGGLGDIYLRIKQRLTPSDAKAQFALIPYIKIPTARTGIGNRKLEGGLVGTGVFTLPAGFSLTLTPEFDDLENANLDGHHAQLVGAVNLSKALSSKVTVNAEVWTSQNYDPLGTVRQYSVDGALAYTPSADLQFDVGTNIGLNRDTPGVQIYAGVARRF
jgi:hypothetical protein